MSTTVRDNLLAITVRGTGSTHYRVAHDETIDSKPWIELPQAEEPQEGDDFLTYLVRYDLPEASYGPYTLTVQLKNKLHQSNKEIIEIVYQSNYNSQISSLFGKLRIFQAFSPIADPDTYYDEVKCFHPWLSLYNNSDDAIDLSTVKLWTRNQDATSYIDAVEPLTPVTDPSTQIVNTIATVPQTMKAWRSVTLSGTLPARKYFLILGKRINPAYVNPLETASTEVLKFVTTGGVDVVSGEDIQYYVDLDLSSANEETEFFISSKHSEIMLTESTVTSVGTDAASVIVNGAFFPKFIDLMGFTADPAEGFVAPLHREIEYFADNSKQQVKTLIYTEGNPITIEPVTSGWGYVKASIKSLAASAIRTGANAYIVRPRNSVFTSLLS